jgi:hypothetical protein
VQQNVQEKWRVETRSANAGGRKEFQKKTIRVFFWPHKSEELQPFRAAVSLFYFKVFEIKRDGLSAVSERSFAFTGSAYGAATEPR